MAKRVKKIKETDYICLSAMLRAKEARLLRRDQFERMLSDTGFADACRAAAEAGYASAQSARRVSFFMGSPGKEGGLKRLKRLKRLKLERGQVYCTAPVPHKVQKCIIQSV